MLLRRGAGGCVRLCTHGNAPIAAACKLENDSQGFILS
jgi:hypothetical protein